ncbi:JAB domain-containing protein [Sphingobacterium thalpophilum]|uniref:JAB domain-containing protein n=1 Tax=Sphingobacterium thalpophilum TaxID=259 RepID=A0ABV4H992_9SPHI
MKNKFIAHELRLSYHKNEKLSLSDFTAVNSSKRMNMAFRKIWNNEEISLRESFYAIYFNTKLDVVGYQKIADGGLDMVLVDIRLLMSNALLSNSTRIAVAHNHPSGSLTPSQADKQLTIKIANACRLLDIQIVDHIILTDIAYYSFKDSGDL